MQSISEKRAKVAMVINGFRTGGAQNVLVQIAERIDKTRFDLSLITLMRGEGDETKYMYHLLPKGIPVYDLRFHNFRDLHAWGTLWRALRSAAPDVVFSNLFFSNTVTRILKPFFGYRVITVEHNTYGEKTFLQKKLDQYLARLTYRIVAVSKTVARFTSVQEHIPLSKFVINYGGIDIGALRKEMEEADSAATRALTGFSPKDKIILTVSRVVPQKNHRLLLEGFALFSGVHPEYRLVAVGGGTLIPELVAFAKELGIETKVRFMGYQKAMYPFFAVADFFASTSLMEGFGTTHAEALAAGLPLVSTKTAGPDEMIQEGVNGFFIPAYTKEAVADSLSKMAAQNLAPMRDAARRSAEAYAMEHMIEKYEALFTAAANA
jgi:glycosyltransferase involved in cell wall biosynthesis